MDLRIGLLLDGLMVPRWFRRALEKTLSLPGVQLVLVVLNRPQETGRSKTYGLLERLSRAFYRRYQRWDRARHVPRGSDALEEVSIEDLIGDAPRLLVEPNRKKCSDWIGKSDLEKIASYEPDLLVCKGFQILGGPILELPRYGVWSYQHGNPELCRGGPVSFWETFYGTGVTGSVLQHTNQKPEAGRFLARTVSPASFHSVALTRNTVCWDSAPLLPRCVSLLMESRDPVHHTGTDVEPHGPIHPQPGVCTTLRMVAKFVSHRLRNSDRLTVQHWSIRTSTNGMSTSDLHGRKYHDIEAPTGHFWAAPCLFVEDERVWLFFEDCAYAQGAGCIRCVQLDEEGRLVGQPRLLMGGDGHYSNPLVFELDGRVWMLPETRQQGRVQLYEATNFPYEWKARKTLLNTDRIVDPVLFFFEGRYWLLGTETSCRGSRVTNLNLWFSDSLDGPWTEHPLNPVVSDCQYGRAAGRILDRHGRLVRPAQDGSGGYGLAINFMEICELNTQTYKERRVDRLDPSELGTEGVHTFSQALEMVAIDVRKGRFRRSVGA